MAPEGILLFLPPLSLVGLRNRRSPAPNSTPIARVRYVHQRCNHYRYDLYVHQGSPYSVADSATLRLSRPHKRTNEERLQELGLAVNVHSRSAGHHAIKLLREEGITRAVFHAFDGKPK